MRVFLFKTFFVVALSVMFATVNAQEVKYKEGIHYLRIKEAQPTITNDKIEVREIFWYGCPYCNQLQPFIKAWTGELEAANKLVSFTPRIPENAALVLMPVAFSKKAEFHAQVFYTLDMLNWTADLHQKLYDAIHVRKMRLDSLDEVTKWLQSNSYDATIFTNMFSSFSTLNALNRAKLLNKKYGIQGTPSIVVDGRYLTGITQAGSFEELFDVINFLVDKADNKTKQL